MFTYVKLKNYKSLVDFEVDLTSSKNNPKKMIIIYGENGAGKSNFINAFFNLFETLNTKINVDEFNTRISDFDKMINNNENNKSLKIIINLLKEKFKTLDSIIKENKTICSKDNMILEFGFKTNGKNGVYYIETNNESIV